MREHNAAAEIAGGGWCTAQPGGVLLAASQASAGAVDAIMDIMSGAGCIRVCGSECILQGCDSIRIEIEFIGLTRCIYGHKGNY